MTPREFMAPGGAKLVALADCEGGLIELLSGELWVWYEANDDGWLWWVALEFYSSSGDGTGVVCERMVEGEGSLSLRECRHTWWGDEGYVFYPNADRIRSLLSWLKQRFDMS